MENSQNIIFNEDTFIDKLNFEKNDLIHIRLQQRNGRKTLTTIQGLTTDYDLKKITKTLKKEFACNGCIIEHPEFGEVIQLQGDQRENVKKFFILTEMAKEDQIKTHGF